MKKGKKKGSGVVLWSILTVLFTVLFAGACIGSNLAFASAQVLAEEMGEVQFTDYGLSGICIMQLSGLLAQIRPALRHSHGCAHRNGHKYPQQHSRGVFLRGPVRCAAERGQIRRCIPADHAALQAGCRPPVPGARIIPSFLLPRGTV